MVFHAIGMWLLAAAVPLWIYRWIVFARLDPRERQIFRRLVRQRHESALAFVVKMFGFLVVLAASVFALIYGLSYVKRGSLDIGAYSDTVRSRLYSGLEPLDQALDAYHYDQLLPVAIMTTCALLSVAFTLAATALRDITLATRLHRKVTGLRHRQAVAS